MAGRAWTIDCWVLYRAAELDFSATELLLIIGRTEQAVLDVEGRIIGEYATCLDRIVRFRKPGYQLVGEWLGRLRRGLLRTQTCSGRLQKRHKRHLLDKLNFDPNDLPYVAASAHSPDKLLVAEEEDYTEAVKRYLLESLNVRVLAMAQALELLERSG